MFRLALGTAIVVGSVLLSCSAHGSGEEGTAPLLTQEKFAETIKEKPHFVMFFAPWCGHCKKLSPVWDELHETLGGFTNGGMNALDVGVARVDCTQETALCSDHQVTGYPTLKFFKTAEEGTRYKGARSLEELTVFVKKQIGLIKEPEPEEEASGPSLPVIYTADSFGPGIASGHHFIKFFAPWCGHCQRLAPIWDQLAESFAGTKGITVGKVDCTLHKEVCTKYGVKGYPTLLWFTDGEQAGEKYAGDRSFEGLRTFSLDQSKKPSEPAKPKDKAAKVDDTKADSDSTPSPPEPKSAVASLNSDTFEAAVKDGITLVKFFAPWCGHCKKMAGAYEELGSRFSDNAEIGVAEVDCTEQRDLCGVQEVKGFPTIILYRDGSKVENYKGDRSTDDMAKYLTAQLTHDEL